MNQKKKTFFNWSSGKDAALALYYLRQDSALMIDHLLTTVNAHHNRVSMHGLRLELLKQQAEAINMLLTKIQLPKQPNIKEYNTIMERAISDLKSKGYTDCGFGDIFLEDLRNYREQQLKPYGIQCHFPLWKMNTRELIIDFIEKGFKAIVICANAELLGESFVGREIDEHFLEDLPANIDPCGENGEFHTFCFDGPIFSKPINFAIGEKVYREYERPKDQETKKNIGFWFCDLIPKTD